MKINGNTQVDLSLTNIDYNLNVGSSNVSIDEYGNQDDKSSNKISLDLDLNYKKNI